jgi:hypothetical protein
VSATAGLAATKAAAFETKAINKTTVTAFIYFSLSE